MKLFVWIWNYPKNYEFTRHNIWFLILDYIKLNFWFSDFLINKKFNSELAYWKIENYDIVLMKPLTYVNLSWNAVVPFIRYYNINIKDLLVIHDDIDLEIWKIKLKFNWSHWWHNWIKDISNKLWTLEFRRLKYWIWRPSTKDEVSAYVLWKLSDIEIKIFEENKNNIINKIMEYLKYTWK